jgi:adenylate cyclase
VMDDIAYPLERVQLHSGDAICVFTDGIIEAMNEAGELYGRIRPIELLERKGKDLSASGLLALLRDDVRAFVGNAEQSDDLTLLVVRWYGPNAR